MASRGSINAPGTLDVVASDKAAFVSSVNYVGSSPVVTLRVMSEVFHELGELPTFQKKRNFLKLLPNLSELP